MNKIVPLLMSLGYAIVGFYFIWLGCSNAYHGHYDVAAFQIAMQIVFNQWADEAYRRSKEA